MPTLLAGVLVGLAGVLVIDTLGAAACLVVGLFDSTVGWALSRRLHPELAKLVPPAALESRGLVAGAFRITVFAVGVGALVAVLSFEFFPIT